MGMALGQRSAEVNGASDYDSSSTLKVDPGWPDSGGSTLPEALGTLRCAVPALRVTRSILPRGKSHQTCAFAAMEIRRTNGPSQVG